MSESERVRRSGLAWLGVLGLVALAGTVRGLGFEWVFLEDGVVFPPADPQYHVRRALYTFVNFPDVLLFDPYINHPGGAPVPWPPLFDFAIGGAARLLASDLHGFEVVAAWAGPLLGALSVVPIYLIGARIASPETGLCAGLVYALLPMGVAYSRVGNADHHAAVALIGAWLLHVCLALVDEDAKGRRLAWLGGLHVALRLALLLTWHGSLLYLALAEGLLLLTAVVTDRPRLLAVQGIGAAAVGVILIPILLVMPDPLGGLYSSIALSRLHLLALCAVAAVAGLLWLVRARRPGLGLGARLLCLIGAAAAVLVAILALPGPRAGLLPAFQFMAMRDGVGLITGEQSPLIEILGRRPARPATLSWGWLVFLIPLAPAAAALLAVRAPAGSRRRAAAWLLAAWGAFFGGLSVIQRRYGNDFAPAASVLFALLAMEAGRFAAARLRRPGAPDVLAFGVAVGLCVALLWPALARLHAPRAQSSWSALTGRPWPRAQAEHGVAATLARFSREVRRVTPETSSFLGGGEAPEYGVIAHANLGHALQYGARRATATDPFWAYIGPENWERSFAFLEARDERTALRLARQLRGRYVVTMSGAVRGSVVARLHQSDGLAEGTKPALRHFRLITEAPPGGLAVGEIFGPSPSRHSPYKLFEIVKGARLELRAAPGAEAVASLALRSSRGRELVYEARATAGPDGIARLRLPYASDRETPTRALGPYRVVVGDRALAVEVPEAAVLGGELLRVPPAQ